MHGRLQRIHNVIYCIDFDVFHSEVHTLMPNITFWSGKWSCFKVRDRVRALFMSSTAYASTKGGKHFLDHKVTPTPEIKKKN